MAQPTQKRFKQLATFTVVLAAAVIAGASVLLADTNQLQSRALKLNDSRAGQTSNYSFSFKTPGLATIQTLVFEICANDPVVGAPCTAPSGLDTTGATLIDQTGDTGFGKTPASTVNKIVLARPPLASNGQLSSYTLAGVVNPDSNGSYYVRISAYPDNSSSGEGTYFGGLAYAINDAVSVHVVVPPYLLFCAGVTVSGFNCDTVQGDYVDFGEFSSRQASQGSTQMLAATNAIDGYNVRVVGSALFSGTNVIPALTSNDVSRPGVSQFGMNLQVNTAPRGGQAASGPGFGVAAAAYSNPNFYQFNSGDIVAASTQPDEARKYTASYVVNIQKGQAPGVYVSTLTYIALGNF